MKATMLPSLPVGLLQIREKESRRSRAHRIAHAIVMSRRDVGRGRIDLSADSHSNSNIRSRAGAHKLDVEMLNAKAFRSGYTPPLQHPCGRSPNSIRQRR